MIPRILSAFSLLAIVSLVGCDAFSPQAYVDSWVEDQRKDLPRQLEPGIAIVDIKSAKMEIITFYKVSGLDDASIKAAKGRFRASIANAMRSNAAGTKQLADYKISTTHVYQNEAGNEVVRITVNAWDKL